MSVLISSNQTALQKLQSTLHKRPSLLVVLLFIPFLRVRILWWSCRLPFLNELKNWSINSSIYYYFCKQSAAVWPRSFSAPAGHFVAKTVHTEASLWLSLFNNFNDHITKKSDFSIKIGIKHQHLLSECSHKLWYAVPGRHILHGYCEHENNIDVGLLMSHHSMQFID